MKKKISRIWSVGLILMMCVSLLLWTAPVSADTLEWDDEDIPDLTDHVQATYVGENVVDIAVAAGGLAVYAATGDGTTHLLYVSTDQGVTWDHTQVKADTTAADDVVLVPDFVAVAPDDPRYIAVTDDIATNVYFSEDGGATFDELTPPLVIDDVRDLAVSVESDGHRWIAVAGVDTGVGAKIEYYEIGAVGSVWEDMTADPGFEGEDVAAAIAFSPNFGSDEVLVAITANWTGATDTVSFEIYTFNQNEWNASSYGSYPVDLTGDDTTALTAVSSASLALSPDYLGSDSDMRLAFYGLAVTGTAVDDTNGIYRLEDDDAETLEDEKLIHSIAFDGSKLLAGAFDESEVYSCADPLASSPDVDDTASNKAPGGEDLVIVAWAGDLAVAATSGAGSGFSISRDNGGAFHDISLIDTDLDTLSDIAVATDGTVFLATHDTSTDDLSIWRMGHADQEADWERVLYEDDATLASNDWIIRCAPDDADVVFLANHGDRYIFYSDSAGEGRWRARSSKYDIFDLAAESADVLYVLEDSSASYVSKSVNTGFSWGGKQTTGMAEGPNTIVSLGEDLVVVGSDDGTVSYSTDGNESWTDLEDTMASAGAVQVTATGLSDGDFIFAATDAGDEINRWELGEDDSWDDFYDEVASGDAITGIGLGECGVLYAIAFNGTANTSALYRFLDPTDGDVSIETASLAGVELSNTPSALRVSGTVLWAIGVDTTDSDLQKPYSYEDTLGCAAPMLKSPSSGFDVPMNEISGYPADVNLVWECPSDEVTQFEIEIALDDGFDEGWTDFTLTKSSGSWDEEDAINWVQEGDDLVPEVTYYWRIKVSDVGPVESNWSETWSFTVEAADAPATVEVDVPPAPEITVEMPAPEVTVTIPPVVTVPPAPAPTPQAFIWGMIVIGALLVVALIVLIIRTRRVV